MVVSNWEEKTKRNPKGGGGEEVEEIYFFD